MAPACWPLKGSPCTCLSVQPLPFIYFSSLLSRGGGGARQAQARAGRATELPWALTATQLPVAHDDQGDGSWPPLPGSFCACRGPSTLPWTPVAIPQLVLHRVP